MLFGVAEAIVSFLLSFYVVVWILSECPLSIFFFSHLAIAPVQKDGLCFFGKGGLVNISIAGVWQESQSP